MYRYKNKKTGKVVRRKTPMPKNRKQDYILIGWIKDMMMRGFEVMKK